VNLPEKYTESMKMMLGDEYDSYIESFNDKRLYGLRVNNLKISTEDFLKICPFKLEPVPWIENGFYYSEDDKPAKHPYYFAGLYYIQEPSAMTPANVLPIEEGDVVFDMCAAPGGKSTELAAKLNKTGLIITNDISNSRAKALLKNVEVFGVPNLCVLNEDPVGIASRFSGFFDKVLIDAPCSGEGMFRKDNKLIKAWEKNGPEFYSQIQRNIILAGADMLKPGGKLLYSTCTFSKLEDEDSVIHLLTNRPDMHLIDIKPYEGFSHGFDTDEGYHLEKAVRIFPHKMPGEGHFVALFEKDGEDYTSSKRPVSGKKKLPDELKEFMDSTTFEYDPAYINIRDTRVFLTSPYMAEERGLRIIRNGLLLGELKKNRFEPSQAFAMALTKDQFNNCLDLPVSDDRVIRYLKGETIDIDDFNVKSGWTLVCVDGYPLGWGKNANGQLKNKYLAGWRWM
jgi:NOL1/NOP2/sun family putative RNA methylase